MSVDLVTRDEADHLARRVTETRKLAATRRARAERRAERWERRYREANRELRDARETIAALREELRDVVKALPLWQPWATLVAIGAKQIETRSWPAPAGLIGERIAIHATKGGLSKDAERDLLMELTFAAAFGIDTNQLSAEGLAEELPRGAIVATAVLNRCTEMTAAAINVLAFDSPREYAFGNYEPGRFAWLLRDVIKLDEPVPFVGRQGIFDVPDDLVVAPRGPLISYRCPECGHVETLDPADWQEYLPACPQRARARLEAQARRALRELDSKGHGTDRRYHKLSPLDVAELRIARLRGESAYTLAKRYGISDTQVRNIVRGDQWGCKVLPCVWLGVSIENRRYVDRADRLRETPAAIRFISAEPLLGPLIWRDCRRVHAGGGPTGQALWPSLDLTGIDWLIVGGESGGPKARQLVEENIVGQLRPKPQALERVRDLRDAAQASGTAFFLKQWGGRTPKAGGRELDGRTWDEFPVAAVERAARALPTGDGASLAEQPKGGKPRARCPVCGAAGDEACGAKPGVVVTVAGEQFHAARLDLYPPPGERTVLVISSFPEKGMDVEIVACDGVFDVDVISHLAFGFRSREAGHPLGGEYDRDRLIDLLMDADNGGADELLKALGLDTREAWDRHLARFGPQPRRSRA